MKIFEDAVDEVIANLGAIEVNTFLIVFATHCTPCFSRALQIEASKKDNIDLYIENRRRHDPQGHLRNAQIADVNLPLEAKSHFPSELTRHL